MSNYHGKVLTMTTVTIDSSASRMNHGRTERNRSDFFKVERNHIWIEK